MSTLTPAGSESSISGLLTCMTCRVGFRDGDLQRDHYKSDWHRYNLKRKIVLLPPVTAENFADRVAAQEALQVESSKDTSKYCTVCKKSFGNEKAFQSHIISKKHSAMIKELSLKNWIEPQNELAKDMNAKCAVKIADDGTVLSSSPGKSPGTGKKFPQSPQTLIKSGFPGKGQKLKEDDMEIESDDDSWEEIEGTPVPINSCLFCSHESKDLEANLEHMSISHSFFIPDVEYCTDIEGLLDYLGSKVGEGMMCLWCNEKGKAFYNVLAVQQHMTDKGHCKMLHDGDAAFEYSDYYDFSSSYPDGSDQVNADEAYQAEPIRFNESMQLVLPNGMALGHRALRVYYRQYVRPAARALAGSRKAKKHNILSQYKAIGYGQTPANIAQQKLRNQRYFKLIKDKYHMKLGMSGNKTLQNYFRRQVQF